ncbi:hypothetical protein SAMN04487770_12942 [Butyrivibrio sp. ob235]|nr:hypothetical protein [Butyrivibrio sp. ob235]SEM22658.1 hypothetical protein SAMN04487770_12942 [Butyrivibrio sp. ob235]
MNGRLIVIVLILLYVLSPVDGYPGPIDDLIVMALGFMALKGRDE